MRVQLADLPSFIARRVAPDLEHVLITAGELGERHRRIRPDDGLLRLDSGDTETWQLGTIMEDFTEPPPGDRYQFDDTVYLATLVTPSAEQPVLGDDRRLQRNIAVVEVTSTG